MKYLVFTFAALGVIPFSYLLSQKKVWIRLAFIGIVAAMCLYVPTSINFFSIEEYRGSSRGMEVSLAHLMAFSVIGALLFSKSFKSWMPDWGYGIYSIYFILCLPSLNTTEDMLISWFEIWKMIMLYFFYIAVYNYLKATNDLKTVLSSLAIFAIVNMLAVVRQHLMGVYQPQGVFPHQNCMAMAMHLFGTIFFAAYLRMGLGSLFSRICCLAFICAAAATVRSYSRMALLLMPVGYGLVLLLCILVKRPRQWFIRIVPIAVAGALGVFLMLPRIVERFIDAPESSGTTRVELARCAKEMIKSEPLKGIGINNWGIKINQPYEYAEKAGRNTNRDEDFADGIVETVYLLVCAECGIPALLAMVAWFGWYYLKCIHLMKRLNETQWFFIPVGLFGGFTIAFTQSCFEWVFRQQLNLVCLMFTFAILSYLDQSPFENMSKALRKIANQPKQQKQSTLPDADSQTAKAF